jgi:hypothetical protein
MIIEPRFLTISGFTLEYAVLIVNGGFLEVFRLLD